MVNLDIKARQSSTVVGVHPGVTSWAGPGVVRCGRYITLLIGGGGEPSTGLLGKLVHTASLDRHTVVLRASGIGCLRLNCMWVLGGPVSSWLRCCIHLSDIG